MAIGPDDILGFWTILESGFRLELHGDGTVAGKVRGSGEFQGPIRWEIRPPGGFILLTFRPGPPGDELAHSMTYRVVRHDKREMLLEGTLVDATFPEGLNIGFQTWKRSKRTATWGAPARGTIPQDGTSANVAP